MGSSGGGDPDLGVDEAPVSFLRQSVQEAVELRVHVLEDGRLLVCDISWRDVVAVVEYGEIEVETPHGARLRLVRGDALCFALTGPVTVRASDGGLALLAAVRHSTTHEPDTGSEPTGSTTT